MAATQRGQAECSNGFNFGDRLVSVHVNKFICSKTNIDDMTYMTDPPENTKEPFLAIYENCDGENINFLVCALLLLGSFGTTYFSPLSAKTQTL